MTDNKPSKLLVNKANASQRISKQINIGKDLLERHLSSEREFDKLKPETWKWVKDNKNLFGRLFDTSPLPDGYGVPTPNILPLGLYEEIMNHRENLEGWINDLENIYEQLDLYVELPSNTHPTGTQDTVNNENKKYFIGHGGSPVWRELKNFLENKLGLPYEEFNRIPQAGKITSNRLKEMLETCCMAFLIMTGEDEHSDGTLHARPNVIHEIGLFQAQLGYERAIILLEEGCEGFSNIHGITYIPFPKGNIRAAFEDIREVLERESITDKGNSIQSGYKYQGQYQTKEIVEELILMHFAGTPKIKREDVLKTVLEYHKSQGGLVNEKSPYTSTALRSLEKKGLAKQLRRGYWRIL